MKIIILFFVLFTNCIFAQESNDKTIYLDSIWNETSKEDYSYYRIIKDYQLEKKEYSIEDYFKSGKIQMQAISLSKDYLNKNGIELIYFENGNKKSNTLYENGIQKGFFEEWYENGQKCIEGEYIFNEKNRFSEPKINNYWNEKNIQKVKDGNGELEEKSKKDYAIGKIKNGFKDGNWTGKSKNYKFNYTEFYENGILKTGTSIDSLNVEHHYSEVFKQPKPKNGIQHFYKFIGNNFIIPKNSEMISGKIVLQFIVNKEGKIEQIEVIKGLNNDLNQEAIRLLKKYPDWEIGEFRGIIVKTHYKIPISITAID